MRLISIGEMPASDGIGSVGVAALTVILALGLMYAVLEIMNQVNKKKRGEQKENSDDAVNKIETNNDNEQDDASEKENEG